MSKSLPHQIAAHELHAQYDSRYLTEKARAAGPGQLPYWERKVDPDGTLDPADRHRRAKSAQRAHFKRMQLASLKARQAKAKTKTKTEPTAAEVHRDAAIRARYANGDTIAALTDRYKLSRSRIYAILDAVGAREESA